MISVTFPGRAGDLLWSLPTVRALAEIHGPVSLRIAGEFTSMLPLLQQQPYLEVVVADHAWSLTPPNDWQPPTVEEGEIHLGYRGWPDQPLAQYIYGILKYHYPGLGVAPLDLDTPWMTLPHPQRVDHCVTYGWSDAWFELKYAVTLLTEVHVLGENFLVCPKGSRWALEAANRDFLRIEQGDWMNAAHRIQTGDLFVGCCSALHVLAVAMGKRVVVMEPMEARHNPIFYPYGKSGRVKLVIGLDGLPTHDARHTTDAIREVLAHV